MDKQHLESFLEILSNTEKKELLELLQSQEALKDDLKNPGTDLPENGKKVGVVSPKDSSLSSSGNQNTFHKILDQTYQQIQKTSNIINSIYNKASEAVSKANEAITVLSKRWNLEKYNNYLFLLLLVIVYILLDYQTILFKQPQGIHFWRQTDSLSFVANYFKHGFDFFHPKVFSLQSTDGNAASEFPILYYLTALGYLLFNEQEWVLRLITVLIASTGFFYLFKLLHSLLHDVTYAIGFTFLFISSTILLYYTNNYLPDASALGLTLIGWYFFYTYIQNKDKKNSALKSFLFFSLASLIKVTFFINPIAAILSILGYDYSKKTGIRQTLQRILKPLIYFIVSVLIILSWTLYVSHYNKINACSSFLIQSRPIWSIDKEEISQVWLHMSTWWFTSYYSPLTFQVFFGILIASILFLRKSAGILFIQSILLAIGTICYFILFYAQFKSHDYYFIGLIPGILFLVTNSFIALRNRFPYLFNNYVSKLLLLTLCILSLNYAKGKLDQRYVRTDDIYGNIGFELSSTRQYLDALGVSKNAKTIILSDNTPNGGLYFINRPGWSVSDTTEGCLKNIDRYIEKGAEYIIFTDKNYIYKRFKGTLKGEENGIMIYKLR